MFNIQQALDLKQLESNPYVVCPACKNRYSIFSCTNLLRCACNKSNLGDLVKEQGDLIVRVTVFYNPLVKE